MVIALGLCVRGERANGVPWRLVKDNVTSILADIAVHLKTVAFDAEEFALILSDLIGILRVIKEFYLLEGTSFKLKKALSRKLAPTIYEECSTLLKLYTTSKFSKPGKQLDAFDADSCDENDRKDSIRSQRHISDSDGYSDNEERNRPTISSDVQLAQSFMELHLAADYFGIPKLCSNISNSIVSQIQVDPTLSWLFLGIDYYDAIVQQTAQNAIRKRFLKPSRKASPLSLTFHS